MRRTDFWERLREVFGPVYATSVAKDQVLARLGGRTIDAALAEGEEVHVIWRAVCEQYSDRVPARLR
ncbi:DUF3046 domain-containing protein [Catellatospora tritici]|uniref:DUF3046 domain-containing protein n=1 Tax=Catellatospora tritici TaxID=2851566 RepID=UPI001C2D0BE4|nr:DUF3046 domain-containing protein [Catellatospora tritici]MBV1848546.1 DUF3046 domain-containing protein [Catellatospora tritici]MBV1851434.1 DUF3046 domain-containing protein [Catellatospora tritici]